MKSKLILLVACVILCFLTITSASASEIDNTTVINDNPDININQETNFEENTLISDENDLLNAKPEGTFTDLANEIAEAGSTLSLYRNYVYNYGDSDYKTGITIDKSITINGNGFTINGNGQARAFSIEHSNVVLKDINFVNGRGTGNYPHGGAVYWSGSNGFLTHCSFVDCSAGYCGGAVYWGSENGVLRDCSFVNCHGNEGGAVYWMQNCVLSGCSFVNCKANEKGGAIALDWHDELPDSGINFISNCDFQNCSVSSGDGGAVYWQGPNGTLNDCSFVNCSCSNYGGSVLWNGNNGVLCDCSFEGSHSGNDGGSVSWERSYGTLRDCSFVNSRSGRDGSAVFWYGRNGALSGCDFMNCHADNDGAVYWEGPNGNLSGCYFVDCEAIDGGAVYWDNANGTLLDCSFADCSAKDYGGGICFNATGCSLIYPTFEGCTAKEGPDWYSVYNIIFIENTKKPTSITAPDVTATYGVSEKLVATLKDADNNILAGEKITILLNNVKYPLETNSKGQASLAIPADLAPKTYAATVTYAGNNKYKASSATANVVVNKAPSALSASDITTPYNWGINMVATLKDAGGKAIIGAQVKTVLNGVTKTLTTDSKGWVSLTTNGLIPDTYTAKITFDGNNLYAASSTTGKITVNKLETKLTAEYDANTKNIIATVKDTKGNPVSGLKVGFALNGVKYATTDANGQAKYSTAGLADGTYKVTVQAYGNEIYKDSNKETVTFTIGSKEMSKIFLRNALYFVTQTKMVQVTLWDGNNQPLANKTVYIRAYDSVWHGVTDENGDAFVRVGIGFGTHDATVSFDGDDQYFGSEKAGYIRVIKQTPSVMVRGADTMFKATNPLKIVKVHLRDRYDQPLPEGSKIVLKLNGKTYIGFTDAEGVARIAINSNTVGTFTAQAMYGGNSAYNPVTRDVKIRIV